MDHKGVDVRRSGTTDYLGEDDMATRRRPIFGSTEPQARKVLNSLKKKPRKKKPVAVGNTRTARKLPKGVYKTKAEAAADLARIRKAAKARAKKRGKQGPPKRRLKTDLSRGKGRKYKKK